MSRGCPPRWCLWPRSRFRRFGIVQSRVKPSFSGPSAKFFSLSSEEDIETHSITCGSSGSITVDLYNFNGLSSASPLIIYLPSGPSHNTRYRPLLPQFLRHYSVAQINYRWNHKPSNYLSSSRYYLDHPFPTPLHDTLHAYTWLTQAFLSKKLSSPIYTYGSHLGGTLATSLALTESRSSPQPPKIQALLAKDAVFDWTSVATTKPPDSSPIRSPMSNKKDTADNHERIWTTQTLHSLKTDLFAQPSSCFDNFASPILFFRTSGLEIPPAFPGTEIPPQSTRSSTSISNSIESPDSSSISDWSTSPTPPPTEASSTNTLKEEQEPLHLSRKSHLTFPPRNSGLKIPHTLIITTKPPSYSSPFNSSLHSKPSPIAKRKRTQSNDEAEAEAGFYDSETELGKQAQEMTRLMRRSIVLHEFRDRVLWDNELDPHVEAEKRVRWVEVDGGEEGDGVEGMLFEKWMNGD